MDFQSQVSSQIFRKNWLKKFSFGIVTNTIEDTIAGLKGLEASNIIKNEVVMIFRSIDLVPVYVTKSIESYYGFTQEEFISWGRDANLNLGVYEQVDIWKHFPRWMEEFLKLEPVPTTGNIHFLSYVGGVQHICKDGSIKKSLMQISNHIGKNNSMAEYHILTMVDVGHLIKDNGFWAYFQKSMGNLRTTRFYTDTSVNKYAISKREKEILMLIAGGKSSKEVAKKLFISPATVQKHRKNLIKRFRARDTTALIHLCKLCAIID